MMKTLAKALKQFAADLIFPNRCLSCLKVIGWKEYFCPECEGELKPSDGCCIKCGMKVCECETQSFSYDGCVSCVFYESSARQAVLNLKEGEIFGCAEYFAPIISEKLKSCGYAASADIVTCVPMGKKRIRKSGVNHSAVIGKSVAKSIGFDFSDKLIVKVSDDLIQHELSAQERRTMVKNAFAPAKNVESIDGKTVILCDDILTTGSTLSECARVLKSMGAKKVYCAVIAVTRFDKEKYGSKNPAGT